jgi:HAD superfamily hydrolase (TIGR01509 family)
MGSVREVGTVSKFPPVRALLFDLDGTLIDSETQTDEAIATVLARYGSPGFSLPNSDTRGRTWAHAAETILKLTGLEVSAAQLEAQLLAEWNIATARVNPIPGAQAALRTAAACGLKLAVVSSSPRSVIDSFVRRLQVEDCITTQACVGGDNVQVGKPDPECFLLAASRLGVEPAEALVFEDSSAGLQAARAAGMRAMFITCCAADFSGSTALATGSFTHYEKLPPDFWARLATGSQELAGRSFT